MFVLKLKNFSIKIHNLIFLPQEESLHILKTDEGFRLIKTETRHNKSEQWKSEVKWIQTGDFLSRGANTLLMRWLTAEKFNGSVETWTCDINGEFILSKHFFHRAEETEINGKAFEVQQVDRVMIRGDGKSSQLSSFFIGGNLIKEISTLHQSVVHLNPFSELPPKKCVKSLQENWEGDLELMSMFLDHKAKRKEELKQMSQIPRVKNHLRDYIAFIIKSKPKAVMDLTVDFVRKLERRGNDHQVYRTASRRHQHN